jgi:hypothetical protein
MDPEDELLQADTEVNSEEPGLAELRNRMAPPRNDTQPAYGGQPPAPQAPSMIFPSAPPAPQAAPSPQVPPAPQPTPQPRQPPAQPGAVRREDLPQFDPTKSGRFTNQYGQTSGAFSLSALGMPQEAVQQTAQQALREDPELQWRVQEKEKQIDAFKNDKTLAPGGPVQMQGLAKLNKELQQLDPQGIFRKGGLMSQQTKAQKWAAQNTWTDPKSGALIGLDAKGTPHVLHKPPDKEELAAKHEERQHALELRKLAIEEAKMKTQTLQADREGEHSRKAMDHFNMERRKEIDNFVKLRFAHEDKDSFLIDPATGKADLKREALKTPPEERIKQGEEYANKKHLATVTDEAETTLRRQGGNHDRAAYLAEYEKLFGSKPLAHTEAEKQLRHKEAVTGAIRRASETGRGYHGALGGAAVNTGRDRSIPRPPVILPKTTAIEAAKFPWLQ